MKYSYVYKIKLNCKHNRIIILNRLDLIIFVVFIKRNSLKYEYIDKGLFIEDIYLFTLFNKKGNCEMYVQYTGI